MQTPGDTFQALLIRVSDRSMHLVVRDLESTNTRYRTSVPYTTYTDGENPLARVHECLSRWQPVHTVGVDGGDCINGDQYVRLCQSVPHTVNVSTRIPKLRLVKSPTELACVRRAGEYVRTGMRAAVEVLRTRGVGMRETEVAGVVLHAMMAAGAEYAAYPVFVASGINGCMGHHAASRRVIAPHDCVFLEVGSCHWRYHAACMHTVYMGPVVPTWFTDARDLLQRALARGREVARAGTPAAEVDRAMRSIVAPEYPTMSQRSGYAIGIGLSTDWAEKEALTIHPNSTEIFLGCVLHLIPWIQLEGVGAIGFSDTVVVRSEQPAASLLPPEHT